jgi:hypothetical protein
MVVHLAARIKMGEGQISSAEWLYRSRIVTHLTSSYPIENRLDAVVGTRLPDAAIPRFNYPPSAPQ